MDINKVNNLIQELKQVQSDFCATFGVSDIITNSKIFEILIANNLGHILIPGHSGSRDAKNKKGEEFEYKHYKESSSNHSWTFNDYTDNTIAKLIRVKAVIFAHIQDVDVRFPKFDWYYEVPGPILSEYLATKTQKIKNNRKMINVSPKQIEEQMGLSRKQVYSSAANTYSKWIQYIIAIVSEIETEIGTTGILTSNKFWEVLVALELGHKVESEQAKHDAIDKFGNLYEYKVAQNYTWSFQDISKEVLRKYLSDKGIILASVDKSDLVVKKIYIADPKKVVRLLKRKLREKRRRYIAAGKEIRRQQTSLNIKDLKGIRAQLVYTFN